MGASRTLVVHPAKTGADQGRLPEGRLAEAVGLAGAIDLDIVAAEIVPLSRPRKRDLVGPASQTITDSGLYRLRKPMHPTPPGILGRRSVL